MIVRRPDIYQEKKNHRDFRTVIFGTKKFLTENRVFSIFAKKFIYLEKKTIVYRRKMSRIFQCQIRGNRTEITAGKICLKKTEKKLATCGIFGGFL